MYNYRCPARVRTYENSDKIDFVHTEHNHPKNVAMPVWKKNKPKEKTN